MKSWELGLLAVHMNERKSNVIYLIKTQAIEILFVDDDVNTSVAITVGQIGLVPINMKENQRLFNQHSSW